MKCFLPTAGLVTLLLSSPLSAQRIAPPQPSALATPIRHEEPVHEHHPFPHQAHAPLHLSAHRVAPPGSTDRYVPIKQVLDIPFVHKRLYELVVEFEREVEPWHEEGHSGNEYILGIKSLVYLHRHE